MSMLTLCQGRYCPCWRYVKGEEPSQCYVKGMSMEYVRVDVMSREILSMLTLCQGSRSMSTLCQWYVKGEGPCGHWVSSIVCKTYILYSFTKKWIHVDVMQIVCQVRRSNVGNHFSMKKQMFYILLIKSESMLTLY